jgi:5-methylcytosine-specific restriction endonuclease McrA
LLKQNLRLKLGAGFFMHPWNGTGFILRKKKASEMREWLRLNSDKRIKRGTERDDGKVFVAYQVGYANGEYWASRETFNARTEHSRKKMRILRKSVTYKNKFNSYAKERYSQRVDVREKIKARGEKWGKENKPRRALHSSNRRATTRNQMHPDHNLLIEEEMRKSAYALTKQTGVDHHVDHIIPIKHGGWHHHDNLQILPAPVNQSKGSSPFWVSSEYKDFRSVPQTLWPEPLIDFYLAMRTN